LLLEREAWASSIQTLYERGFIDLHPGQTLDQLSRDDLLNLAKRCHRGPTTWKKYSGAEVSQTYTVEFDKPQDLEGANYQQAILVPGGQYLLFRSNEGELLACWELATGDVIWTFRPLQEGYFFRGMAIDVVQTEEGPVIDILVGLRRMINVGVLRKK